MLRVPVLRQPNETACLPTCVRATLAYLGYTLSNEDAAAICHTRKGGSAAELAVEGLNDAGLDAELLQFESVMDVREAIESGQPVVAILQHPSGGTHAVVVCDVGPDTVTVMDPSAGRIPNPPDGGL